MTILERSGEIILDGKLEGDHQRPWAGKGPERDASGEKGEKNVECGSQFDQGCMFG